MCTATNRTTGSTIRTAIRECGIVDSTTVRIVDSVGQEWAASDMIAARESSIRFELVLGVLDF